MYKIINKKKLFVTVLADIIGNIIFFPRRLLRRQEKISLNIREILIIRTAYIGDVVMTLPMLKPLKTQFPEARISFLTSEKAKAVLVNNPYIDEIITFNPFWFYGSSKKEYFGFIRSLKRRNFDMVIEARGDIRELLFIVFPLKARFKVSYDVGGGGYFLTHVVPYEKFKHKVEYHLDMVRYLGCKVDDIEGGIYLTENEERRVDKILDEAGIKNDKPLVAIHPGARKELKCWSADRYAALADALIEKYNAYLVITGSPDEVELVHRISGVMKHKPLILAGNITLRELAGILKRCNLFICNDSAPLHIASTMKTPTVAIFGPSKSKETEPYGNIHRVVEKDFPCRYSCDENICKYKVYNECMAAITIDDVCDAVEDIVNTKITIRKNLLSSEDRVPLS
ncbi:MAG: putative lipopolysaccharide heptosyltransferase III [Nitrospirota bacterium]